MEEESLGAVVVGKGFGVLTHVRTFRAAGIDDHSEVDDGTPYPSRRKPPRLR
jgi:hypothetical protein